jgi:DNA-binding transcriptional ArsR family regulator
VRRDGHQESRGAGAAAGERRDLPGRGEPAHARSHHHEKRIRPGNYLVLVPSLYVWPHVRANCDPPWPLGLVYPAPAVREERRIDIPSGELLRVLRALADDTRLRLLRVVAERPRSTQELAPLLHISEATCSKHLRLLAEAGILQAKRDGYYVLYSLDRTRLSSLMPSITAFLVPDTSGNGEFAGKENFRRPRRRRNSGQNPESA